MAMATDLVVQKGFLYRLGVHFVGDDVSIIWDGREAEATDFGIVIYQGKNEMRIPFTDSYKIGGLYCVTLKNVPFSEFRYLFYQGDTLVADPYAVASESSKKFGVPEADDVIKKSVCKKDTYDWGEDTCPKIPYADACFYKLHMRGFTKHSSSKVKQKGSFAGCMEKIPYMQDLGVTSIIAMPIYDFEDVILNPKYKEQQRIAAKMQAQKTVAAATEDAVVTTDVMPDSDLADELAQANPADTTDELAQANTATTWQPPTDTWQYKTNFWGYTESNRFYQVKKAYAAGKDAEAECKDLIKALHQAGMEFILQLYVPTSLCDSQVLDICQYWVEHYHVDGFFFMGAHIPRGLLVEDPCLSQVKLIFENDHGFIGGLSKPYPNVAVMEPGFLYDARRFLKGDENMASVMAKYFIKKDPKVAHIYEITSYQGFTLADVVCYEQKHNEANGENNRDGSDYNYSWNCGVEGKSAKKATKLLRKKQCRNLFAMLLLSQATPCLLAGDECLNSAEGNNNPYCQDNAISYIQWKDPAKNDMYAYVKELLALRREQKILHMDRPLAQMDTLSCGYPDVSYHGEQAWYPQFEPYVRHLGLMYSQYYGGIGEQIIRDVVAPKTVEQAGFLYVAYNMHWIHHEFALPKIGPKATWRVLLCTDTQPAVLKELNLSLAGKQQHLMLPPRCVVVLVGEQ